LIVAALAAVVAGISVKKLECPSVGTARLPHPKECTLYYTCQNGESKLHECPEGLHFNNAIKQCDWPPAGCTPGINRPETQPAIPEEEEEEEEEKKEKEEINGCIGTCPLEDPMDKTIHLPYRHDCAIFCKCTNGTPVPMKCPDGLHFHQTEQVCDWPWRAKCQW